MEKNCCPCRVIHKDSPNSSYFYTETLPSNGNSYSSQTVNKTPKNSARKKHEKNSKEVCSDSKIGSANKEERLSKSSKAKSTSAKIMDPQSVNQLKQDMDTIKHQLLILNRNKSNSRSVTKELLERHTALQRINADQEKLIVRLREENQKLLGSMDVSGIETMKETKRQLDLYEAKLDTLYREFMDSSQLLEECKRNATTDFHNSKTEFSQVVAAKDASIATLMESCEEFKQNEKVLKEQNMKLMEEIEELEEQLKIANTTKASLQNEALLIKSEHEDLLQQCNSYAFEIEQKSQALIELHKTVDELKSQSSVDSQEMQKQISKLQLENEELLIQKTIHQAEEAIREKQISGAKEQQILLLDEVTQLKTNSEKLVTYLNEYESSMAKLSNTVLENEKLIEEKNLLIASKEKQLEMSSRTEERLTRKTAELEEQLVEKKLAQNAEEKDALTNQEIEEIMHGFNQEMLAISERDHYIRNQRQCICSLNCALEGKCRELKRVRRELGCVQRKLVKTVVEKQALLDDLEIFKSEEDPS